MRRLVIVSALCALLLSACGGSDHLVGAVRASPNDVSATTVTDVTADNPSPFALKAQPGKLLVLYFGYTTCPDICPTTMANLRTACEALGDDKDKINVAFLTVDRDVDTPQAIRSYLGNFGFSAPVGRALRPQSDDELAAALKAMRSTSGITKNPDGTRNVGHLAWTYVINDKGTVVVEWSYGTAPKDIEHDLRILEAKWT